LCIDAEDGERGGEEVALCGDEGPLRSEDGAAGA
jgi:hypothetical protein